jgi:broad specificity phosphatase PhoE
MIRPVLVLFRHGNTFESGETPVWVGARTDLPLTEEGEKQAETAALYVRRETGGAAAAVAGPLRRTLRFAEIIGKRAGIPVSVDERLREIDYGLWEGLSGAEIKSRFGTEKLEAWENEGAWPDGMGWSPPFDVLLERLRDFLREQKERLQAASAPLLAVTSNGVLRMIHRIITGQTAGAAAKVGTGRFCVLIPEGGGWKIETWNGKP